MQQWHLLPISFWEAESAWQTHNIWSWAGGGDKVGQQWHLAQSMCFLSIWTLHSPSQEKPKFTSFCFDLMRNGCFLPGSLYVFFWSVTRLSNKYRRITNEVESAVMMTRQPGALLSWTEKILVSLTVPFWVLWCLSVYLLNCWAWPTKSSRKWQ